MTLLLSLLPWLGLAGFLLLAVRPPRPLPEVGAGGEEGPEGGEQAPLITVVVPARNESANIQACVRSLTASDHPAFEVVVVDDRSDDGTAELVRALPAGNARSLRVVEGEPLPEGWLGKPWACWQGAGEARGEVLLFTDADTVHGPGLLGRAVAELRSQEADLLTVAGRQLMGSFWERLVQPQIFFTMLLRYWNVERWVAGGRWRDAIANGQYMMFPREAYAELGGHEAVKGEVVEDLALAQRVVRTGRRLCLRMAEDALATRMYRSLGELVRGWGKNIHVGGLQTMPPRLRPFVPAGVLVTGVGLWLLPPLALAAGAAGWVGAAWTLRAAGAVAISLALWAVVYRRMGAPTGYALLYPLGAAVGSWIHLRSWWGGLDVEWKGRRYRLDGIGE